MAWTPGTLVVLRGAEWRVVGTTPFSDCEAIDLADERCAARRTLLLPFDRPRPASPPRLQVMSRKRWAHEVASLVRTTTTYGGLSGCSPRIDLLPYQLEPALAVFRHGICRLLVADDVGLGKTVEAGLIVRELAERNRLSRTLIVAPAVVREQWGRELSALFELTAIDADAAWLRRTAADLPADVNPWSVPGTYLCSLDFVKRAEALHQMEEVRWDLLIVDEAHLATPGSDRQAAIHALALRSRVVVLLTATPHSGEDAQFDALCGIGASAGSPGLVAFSRTKADVHRSCDRPRSAILPVGPTDAERRMHRLLEQYTSRIWRDARDRNDAGGELVATTLRKRALSSASSLTTTLRRLVEGLDGVDPSPAQLFLPLDDGEGVGGDECELLPLAASDPDEERRLLTALADQSELAAAGESKLRALRRYLRRLREPAIVFTQYRDTAERIRRELAAAGHAVCVLHGGLSARERSAVSATFNSGGHLLIATDAASEGLNLHYACRVVVHFELPWTPLRLHQRRGRVDRIGQRRPVHEMALVADDTCERLVLGPLLRRTLRARGFATTKLVEVLPESRVAAHVIAGEPIPHDTTRPDRLQTHPERLDLREEGLEEARRLALLRRVPAATDRVARPTRSAIPVARGRGRGAVAGRLTVLLRLTLFKDDGRAVERRVVVLACDTRERAWSSKRGPLLHQVQHAIAGMPQEFEAFARRLLDERWSALAGMIAAADSSRQRRDEDLRREMRSAARELVQPGLFDRRAMRAASLREHQRQAVLDELRSPEGARPASPGETKGRWDLLAVLAGALS